jgi:molybdopterin/thiamine biosynthesis adenylyltransferase
MSLGLWDELTRALVNPREVAAVLLAEDFVGLDGSRTIVIRDLHHVPAAAYDEQSATGLSIRSSGWVHVLARAEREGLVPILAHTHPSTTAEPSLKDECVTAQLVEVADVRLSRPVVGTLILGGSPGSPTFTGALHRGPRSTPIDRIRVAGSTLRFTESAVTSAGSGVPEVFDRQVRAFGPDGQRALASLRVGVIGAGGTGSAVLQQLSRLGVGDVLIVDPQTLTSTNVTRVFGSTTRDDGLLKVDIAAREVNRIGLGTTVTTVAGNVVSTDVVAALADRDVLFGCTDDHAGRNVLTRLPALLDLILIDMGVMIGSHDGIVEGVYGRVTVVGPGDACLFCSGDIDPAHLTAAQRPEDEAEQLRAEGYAPELATRDPAVVAYTALVAAWAVGEMLDRVLLHTDEHPPSRLLIMPNDRKVSRQRPQPRGSHWCGLDWRERPRGAGRAGLLDAARTQSREVE